MSLTVIDKLALELQYLHGIHELHYMHNYKVNVSFHFRDSEPGFGFDPWHDKMITDHAAL